MNNTCKVALLSPIEIHDIDTAIDNIDNTQEAIVLFTNDL